MSCHFFGQCRVLFGRPTHNGPQTLSRIYQIKVVSCFSQVLERVACFYDSLMAPSQPASYHYWNLYENIKFDCHRRFWSSIGSAALANGSSARLNFDTCNTKKVNFSGVLRPI
ncbi:uncharacterized protein LOC121048914 isoform X2 [Rosa chinensis]|uniref:uncharacterized protein LOC121048914 isoform X2 n=1 Tax=Rosa chinensis TaxID=74649 RepID=UPI001AD941D0|nr:uncharacterized protein LOC121048914 isoform X2 [Rosa chinensis]